MQTYNNTLAINKALIIFGLKQLPDEDTLKSIYRTLAKIYHSDHNNGDDKMMKKLTSVYNLLKQNIKQNI